MKIDKKLNFDREIKNFLFSSGNDLTQSIDGDPNEQDILRKPIDALVKSFINFPKILICLINGPCIGITATTMALADIAYCHESAYFYTPFTALGLCAEGCSSYLFPAILGSSKANELLSLNHRLTAEEAYQFGLVAKVYKNESEIWEKLRQIDDLPLGSIMANKRLVRAGRAKMLEEIHNEEVNELTKRFETEEAIEAMIKFQMKRKSKL